MADQQETRSYWTLFGNLHDLIDAANYGPKHGWVNTKQLRECINKQEGAKSPAMLTREELATVLAALRHYQNCGYGDPMEREDAIHEIATDGGDLTSLDDVGINELCERLNGAEG